MLSKKLYILLADNDTDDCYFIWEVLKEISLTTHRTNVLDEEELMELLTTKTTELPAFRFPDLNITRKKRFECLSTIRCNEKIKHPPAIIYSTSFALETAKMLYQNRVDYYIQKPNKISLLKKIIQDIITQLIKEFFVLAGEKINSQKLLWFNDFFKLSFHPKI